jgi:hypothetical protein
VQLQRDQNESQIIPTLLQIQNYIKYRRIAMGNANDIDEATEFVKKLAYKPRVTKDHELFVFGKEMGNGSVESFHFPRSAIFT